MPTLQVRTLRQFLESDQVIDCDCSNYWECAHTGPLKIEMAVQRLGWEFDFYAGREVLAAHVYCSICGKYHPTFRLGLEGAAEHAHGNARGRRGSEECACCWQTHGRLAGAFGLAARRFDGSTVWATPIVDHLLRPEGTLR